MLLKKSTGFCRMSDNLGNNVMFVAPAFVVFFRMRDRSIEKVAILFANLNNSDFYLFFALVWLQGIRDALFLPLLFRAYVTNNYNYKKNTNNKKIFLHCCILLLEL